ncbi:hypothetical protein EV359DRAFT_88045 [Lentinula novae-zelandiae]|nr:hypothetical protein EV359DRAFT_88045 [Lentinula novae-zelandiae]
MLKAQAKTVNYFSAIIFLFLLTILLYPIAVSFQEGILERFDYLLQDALTIIWVQAGMVSSMLFLTILLLVACAIYHSRCQRRVVADEEIHLEPGNMAEAEVDGLKTLEEMLAPLLKDIDAIYEKMEEAIEEPLIKLPQLKS